MMMWNLGNTATKHLKFRERLEGWLDLVRAMWPECPAAMDTTGTGLVGRQSRCRPAGGRKMMRTSERQTGIWRLSLEQIEATVADHLGNGRVPVRRQLELPAVLPQLSMLPNG
jgi:hypothetical protein